MKRAVFATMMLCAIVLGIEAMSWATLWALKTYHGRQYSPRMQSISAQQKTIVEHILADRSSYWMHSRSLGWTIRPNSIGRSAGALSRSNSQGLRSVRDYSLKPPEGCIRIAAFGDSFTHGDNVENDETWQTYLEAIAPKFEVLNFGVGGYGPDQAFLRYREYGVEFRPHVVVIGFMSENIHRTVNTFRPFYAPRTAAPLGKPRFRLDGEGLALLPNPLADRADLEALLRGDRRIFEKLAAHDYFAGLKEEPGPLDGLRSVRVAKILVTTYRRWTDPNRILNRGVYDRDGEGVYNTESEAYKITLRILQQFYRSVEAHGATPVIAIYPWAPDLEALIGRQPNAYGALVTDLKRGGLRTIDLLEAFRPVVRGPEDIARVIKGHYRPAGNKRVAEFLYQELVPITDAVVIPDYARR